MSTEKAMSMYLEDKDGILMIDYFQKGQMIQNTTLTNCTKGGIERKMAERCFLFTNHLHTGLTRWIF